MHTAQVHVNRKRNIAVSVPYKGGSSSVEQLFESEQTKQWERLENAFELHNDPIWQNDPEMHVVVRDPIIRYLSYLKWDHKHLIYNVGRFIDEDELLGESAVPHLATDQHIVPQVISQLYKFDENFFISLRNSQDRIVESLSMPDDPLNIRRYFTSGISQISILSAILCSAYYNSEVFNLNNLVTHKTKYYWLHNSTQEHAVEFSQSDKPGFIRDNSQNFIVNLIENLELDIPRAHQTNYMVNHGSSSALEYFAKFRDRVHEMKKYYALDYEWINSLKFENADNPTTVA